MTESSTQGFNGWLARVGHAAWRWSWRAVALVLIGTAVLLTLARLLLPFADQYQAELEERVESYLGYEVSIGKLDIDWQGLGPRVSMWDLQVLDAGAQGDSIVFERAYIRLRPVIRDGVPGFRFDDFSLIGFTLRTRMDEQGRIHAFGQSFEPTALAAGDADKGAEADSEEGGGDADGDAAEAEQPTGSDNDLKEALERIFSIRRLRVREADLEIARPDGSVIRWRDFGLTLENVGDRHRLAVHVVPPESVGERLTGQLSFTGAPADYREWQASLYVDVRSLVLERLSMLWPDTPVHASDGRLDARMWSEWNDGRLVEANLDVGADKLALSNGPARVTFERVAGRLRLWQPDPAQWQIDATDIVVRRNDRSWESSPVSYSLEDDGDWRLAAGFLRTEDVAAVSELLPLADQVRAHLREHAPRGDVHGLNLAVSRGGDFRLRADFRDFGWAAHGDIPGMTGLDGRTWLRPGGGRVALESSGVDFDAPKLFRNSLSLQELSAIVSVQPTDDGFLLNAPRVHVRNQDLHGRGRASVELIEGQLPRLDLQFDYQDAVATAVPRYLPAGIMPDGVVEWLDQAFRGGRAPQGSFILRGAAGDFPYRDHNGIFDVRFEVADTTLHYGDGWPALTDLAGHVHFRGPSLEITADRGGTRDLRLRRGRARFEDLREGLLGVDLEAIGPLDDMLAVIAGSPLQPRFAPVLEGTAASGEADLSLALSVPVDNVEETRVGGTVELDGAGLTQRAYGLAFDQIRGSIEFTENSVSIEDLRARLRQRPIRVDADTRDGIARFRVAGRFAPAELLPGDPGGELFAALSGRSRWQVNVDTPLQADGDTRLSATSDLEGVRVDLPEPLGKPAGESRRVEIGLALGGDMVSARYGQDVRLVLEMSDGSGLGVRRAGLAFSGPARLPASKGMRISGELARLPLGPWLEHAAPGSDTDAGPALVELDLRARQLDLGAHALSDASLTGRQTDNGGWDLVVASNEATGRMAWPASGADGTPVEVRFEWIDLALMEKQDGVSESATSVPINDPSALPPLDMHIERLKLTDFTLQEFSLLTVKGERSLTMHQIGFETEHLRVNGQGSWWGGNGHRTDVRMVVRSEDFGSGLSEIGHGGILADGEGRVILELDWPSLPWDPAVATVSGDVNINIKDGVLTEVRPGAARLLGLFSLEVIPFRSLLESGLIFDKIKGRVDLADGNAYTKLLEIDSNVGLIKIRGRTGLVARDYDQHVVVVPELSNSLPVLGFLSGGPLAGAAIALIQGVMRNVGDDGDKVDEGGRIEYTVTGSWDDPVIKRLNEPEEKTRSRVSPPKSPP